MLKGVPGITAIVVLGSVLAACGSSQRNLYHYHRTVVGVDIAGNISGDTPSGHLTLGYSRRLIVFLPPEVQQALQSGQPTPTGVPLPSSVFCTQVKASLGGISAFREILATGHPAEDYAARLATESAGLTDWKDRNFVCPGFEIPAPDTIVVKDKPNAAPTAAPLAK